MGVSKEAEGERAGVPGSRVFVSGLAVGVVLLPRAQAEEGRAADGGRPRTEPSGRRQILRKKQGISPCDPNGVGSTVCFGWPGVLSFVRARGDGG